LDFSGDSTLLREKTLTKSAFTDSTPTAIIWRTFIEPD